jgi:hypothetical protein
MKMKMLSMVGELFPMSTSPNVLASFLKCKTTSNSQAAVMGKFWRGLTLELCHVSVHVAMMHLSIRAIRGGIMQPMIELLTTVR